MTGDRPLATSELETRILSFLRAELLPAGASIDRETPLLEDLLDSVDVLRLVTFVDEALGVRTEPSDFLIENFRDAAAIAAYVTRRREDADDGGGSG